MGVSKHAVILLTVTLAGIAPAGTGRQVPSSQTGRQAVSGGQPRTDAEAVNLFGQESELARRAQVLEFDLAGIDAGQKALQGQIVTLRGSAGKRSADVGQLEEFTKKLSRLTVDKAGKEAQLQVIRRQLERVQGQLTQIAPVAPRTDAQAVNLGGQKSELAQRTQVLELDLAGIDARQKALQEQIAAIRVTTGEESAGSGQMEEFTRGLRRLAIDQAAKEAQLQTVRRQIEEVQQRLSQVAPSAPGTDQEAVNLRGQKSELARRAQVLEMDLAGTEAQRRAVREQIAAAGSTGGGPLEEFTKELKRLAVDHAGQEAQLQTVRRQIEEVQNRVSQVVPSAPRTDQEVVNLRGQKSELARRAQVLEMDLAGIEARRKAVREQIAAAGSAGGGPLEEFREELRRLAVGRAGQEARLLTVRRQVVEVEEQLAQALARDR